MKVLRIVLAILLPVAVVAAVAPVVYPLVSPIEGAEFDFGKIFQSLIEMFQDLPTALQLFGIAFIVMLAAPLVGALLFVLWIVFGIVKRRRIGILFGIIALVVLTFGALGAFINAMFDVTAKALEVENSGYVIMQYVELGAIVLFIAAFVVHVIIMFKAAKARKAAKKAAEAKAREGFEVNYDDLPPVLFEKTTRKEREPDVVRHKVEHIERGENHILKGHYVRDDEIDAILAASSYRYEDEIPEEILALLDAKHEAEQRGERLPMFDPNFVPSREQEAIYTDDELRIFEALRRCEPEVEEVPDCIRGFLNNSRSGLTEEEESVIRAMKANSRRTSYRGEYVDLPFFRKHEEEEPVEFVEEIVRVEEPEPIEEDVEAPKVSSDKPVHISRNKEGKFQLKQVGEKKPFAVYDSEEEAIKYGNAVKRVYGVAVRLHDSEGKISSL